jgi:multidrug efflux pump subunit AcrA (membrane-fusion protein)
MENHFCHFRAGAPPKVGLSLYIGEQIPHKNLILRNPRTGTVLMKNAFEGQRVSPQDELYVVADLSTIWVQARVYEYELPHVELGQRATVTIPALPGREYVGKVVFIQPTLDEATRTVQVRVELPNQDGGFPGSGHRSHASRHASFPG